jgi:dockerin type I repeat protein/Kelch motif protein
MKHLHKKFHVVSGVFFARTSSTFLVLAALFIFSQRSVLLAQRKELPANSIGRMLNSMRASGRLPVSSNTLGENPAVLASLQASWTAGAVSPPVARYAFAQAGEDLYVISGEGAAGPVTTVKRYNATTNVWTTLAPIPVGSEAPAAAYSSSDNKIYVVDGSGGTSFRTYDIATNGWTASPPRPGFTDGYGVAVGAYQGKVFVVGGDTGSGEEPTLSIYTISSNSWSGGPNAPAPYQLGGFTQVGRFLYLVGSYGPTSTSPNSNVTMRLDMSNNTWSMGPVWTPQRTDFALASNGTKLFAMGGDTTGGGFFNVSAQVDELETSTWPSGSWINSPPNLPSARQGNSAGFFTRGRVGGEIWSTGGFNASFTFLTEHLFRLSPLQLITAVSRKSHGGTPFDIPLPFTGAPGVECRAGSAHTLVFTFTTNVASGSTSVTAGTGVAGAATFSGNTMTVPLTGVIDQQQITVTLNNVTDASAQVLPPTSVSMNVLFGDANGNKSVNATDVSQTKSQSGTALSATNFRSDVNFNGTINATDVSQVKLNTGHGVP